MNFGKNIFNIGENPASYSAYFLQLSGGVLSMGQNEDIFRVAQGYIMI